MAILSNINGKFAVESSGAIQLSGSAGTSGYVLKSNGTGSAASWVDPTTIIGGPYLPLSGGTLTGATATASGISFTFGGTAQFDGDMTLPAAADNFDIGFNLSTTGKIRFGNTSWNNSLGLESYWMVLRTNQNEGLKLIDSAGNTYVQLNASNNSAGAYNSTFSGANTYNKIQSFYSGSYTSGWKFSDYNGGIWYDAGTDDLYVNGNHANSQIILQSGGATALTLDSSQNAIFAGNLSGSGSLNFALNTNAGYVHNFHNPNTGTSAYVELQIGEHGNKELRIGSSSNYSAPEWNNSWVYAIGRDLALKSNSNVKIYSGGNVENSVALIANSSGQIGIGTTSPEANAKLDVRAGSGGKIVLGSYNANYKVVVEGGDQLNFYNGASGTTAYMNYAGPGNILLSRNLFVEANSSGGTSGTVRIKSNGNVGIGTTNPTSPTSVARFLSIEGSTAGIVLSDSSDSNYKWDIWNSSGGLFMKYNDTTFGVCQLSNGNVGIGNTLPGAKLTVGSNTHGNATGIEVSAGSGGGNVIAIDGANNHNWFPYTDGNNYYSSNNHYFRGGTNNTPDYMVINSSGNVGIGTTNPQGKLTVKNSTDTDLEFGSEANGTYLQSYNRTSSAWGYLRFIAGGGERIRITQSGGEVLINHTSDLTGQILQVNGMIDQTDVTKALRVYDGSTFVGGIGSGQWAFSATYATDYALYAQNNLLFHAGTGNSIDMIINGSHNVGIGTTSPNEKLTVAGNVNITGTGALLRWNSGDIQIRNAGSYAMAFDTYSGSALVERMRIKSGGYIGMNVSPSGFATLEIENISSTTYGLYVDYIDTNASYGAMKVILTGASTSPSYVDWWYGATQTGAVVTTGSSTQYLTSSDYRLKENIVPMSNAIDRVKQLKPSRFNFIGHENTVDGLIAHEVAEIVPEAVNGEKDGLRDDGTPKYQGIDEGKLVPLLIGAIQELEARVKELENK